MSSSALQEWRTVGLSRLAELERVHVQMGGSSPGRRWGTTQLNRSLFVTLVAQFQGFCRALHDDAVDVHVSQAAPAQQTLMGTLLTQGRKLDVENPRRSSLGADFGRLGFGFIDDLKALGPTTRGQLDDLDRLVDYRNAISHGNEGKIASLEAGSDLRSTKASYQRYRRSIDKLAGTMDAEVARQLAVLLGVRQPW